MQIVSTQKNIVISPTKIRPVVREIKNLSPEIALEVLPLVNKRGAKYIEKVIRSAMANAKLKGVNPAELSIKEIQVNEGPRLKRGRPVSRGMWHPYVKKMSHIRVVLETTAKSKVSKKNVDKKTTSQKVFKSQVKQKVIKKPSISDIKKKIVAKSNKTKKKGNK